MHTWHSPAFKVDCKWVGSCWLCTCQPEWFFSAQTTPSPDWALLHCFWPVSVGFKFFKSDLKPSRTLQCQPETRDSVARALSVRLRLWLAQSLPLSYGLHHMSYVVRQPECLTPTVKKCVTYHGLICPSIKTNMVKIWSNKVKIWVNKVEIKYK